MQKNERLYGLFDIEVLPNGKKKYHRVHPASAYRKSSAVKIWQGALLQHFLDGSAPERCLRSVGHAL
jgi:hypothetical protein